MCPVQFQKRHLVFQKVRRHGNVANTAAPDFKPCAIVQLIIVAVHVEYDGCAIESAEQVTDHHILIRPIEYAFVQVIVSAGRDLQTAEQLGDL